jgi:hypothetical protein
LEWTMISYCKAKNDLEARLHVWTEISAQDNTRHALSFAGPTNTVSGNPPLYLGRPSALDYQR